jgi:probable F420-dependent oxidoreductase
MKLGMTLTNLGPLATPDNIVNFAQAAENLGFASLWVTERLLLPVQPRQPYAGGAWPDVNKQVLDPLDALVFAAAITQKIRLGTSVLDFPFYTPARLAKRIATLDVLSKGRAVIGGGVGWSEDEFLASNVPYKERGARLTEMIKALNALWGPDPVEFHGKFYEIPASTFGPKPVQTPHPPLLLGGFVPAALKRAARLADGFNPVVQPSQAAVEAFFKNAHQAWQEAGRAPAKPEIVLRVNHGYITNEALGADRPFLIGSVAQVRQDVKKVEEWGATEIFFDVVNRYGLQPSGGPRLVLEQMKILREIV